jgi:hypothetical protein
LLWWVQVLLESRGRHGALLLEVQGPTAGGSSRGCTAGDESTSGLLLLPHHALIPAWHYDMVTDVQRNAAYDAAIRCGSKRLSQVSPALNAPLMADMARPGST